MELCQYLNVLFLILLAVFVRQYENENIDIDPNTLNLENWTSCEEFLNKTTFNKDQVIDKDWKIFYFWNYVFEESYIVKFSVPSTALIDRFRTELDEELNPPVNWTDAELFMETAIDFSGLLIKLNSSGRYRMIPAALFTYVNLPTPIFALKLVDSDILGIVNCKWRLCYALAPVDNMPRDDKLDEAAAKLEFWGHLNRSYVSTVDLYTAEHIDEVNIDDAEEDEEFEIVHDSNNLQLL